MLDIMHVISDSSDFEAAKKIDLQLVGYNSVL